MSTSGNLTMSALRDIMTHIRGDECHKHTGGAWYIKVIS